MIKGELPYVPDWIRLHRHFPNTHEAATPNVCKIIRPISTTKVRIITSTPYSAIIADRSSYPQIRRRQPQTDSSKVPWVLDMFRLDCLCQYGAHYKAPKEAAEKPTIEAKRTMQRQSPIATINKVSSFKYFFSFWVLWVSYKYLQ